MEDTYEKTKINNAADCTGCQLTSLNISNNPALEEIFCSANKLSSLDLSNDPALKLLYCDLNQLTSLDITKNPLLEQDNFTYDLDVTIIQ